MIPDSDIPTAKCWPPEVALGARALACLLAHLGEQEEGGPNCGPVVEWAVGRWTHQHPDGSGWAMWCAGAACSAFLDAGSAQIREIGSLSVPRLWQRCVEHQLVLLDVHAAELLPGDLVFFDHLVHEPGQAPRWSVLAHVGLVEKLVGTVLHTVEGNSGNAVARQMYDLDGTHPTKVRIHGYARVVR